MSEREIRKPNKSIRTRVLVIATAAVFALSLAAALALRLSSPPASVARVSLDGQVLYEIDLSAVDEEMQLTIDAGEGYNVIAVRKGGIRVVDADCPDRVCVNRGWLTGGRMPIVCLPHRLVIELVSGGDAEAPDAISG